MNRNSIRVRLTFWYTLVLAAGLVAFSSSVWLMVRHFLFQDLVTSVSAQSSGLQRYLRIEDQDPHPDLASEADEYSRSLPQPHLMTVVAPSGKVLFSNWNYGAGLLHLAAPDNPSALILAGGRYYAVSRTVNLNEGTFQVFFAIPSGSAERTVRLLGFVLLGMVPFFVTAGALGGHWLSSKALSPVDDITARARQIGLSNLSERLPVPATGDAFQRLTETWNAMLERLERAVTEIRQFTADASHELRTPVAIIRLAAENALRRSRPQAEYQESLRCVHGQALNMTSLLENLLFLARADTQLVHEEMRILDARDLIEKAAQDVAPLAEARQIHLAHSCHENHLLLRGNAEAVMRLLLILLDNAIKYTPQNGAVRVSAEQRGSEVVLQVADTGHGIPEDLRGRVFERFFRVDPSRNRQSGGYGLGLTIATTIARQHGARIEIAANPGGGSLFSVALPAAQQDVSEGETYPFANARVYGEWRG